MKTNETIMTFVRCFFFPFFFSLLVSIFAQSESHAGVTINSTFINETIVIDDQIQANFSKHKIIQTEKLENCQFFNFTTTKNNLTTLFSKSTSRVQTEMIPIFDLRKFKSIKINFNNSKNELRIDFVISANQTKLTQNADIKFFTSFNCTSKNNQMWSHKIVYVFTENNFVKESVNSCTLFRENIPISESLIGQISDAQSDNCYLDEITFYFKDPLRVSNLKLLKINQTTLNMTWTNPEYSYDSINLTCILNEKYNFKSYERKEYKSNLSLILERANDINEYFLLKNLIPGSNYTCWLITRITKNNFSLLIKSRQVHQTTEPSNLSMHNFKLNDLNKSISFEYRLPKGFYDNFSISVVDLISNEEISTHIFHNNFTQELVFTQLNLTSGKSYKIYSQVKRFDETNFKNLVSFSFRPDPVMDLKIYAISKHKVNVSWKVPIYYKSFMVNTSFNQILKIRSNSIELNEINTTNFSLSVSSCSTIDCDLISKYLTTTFDLESPKFSNFTKNFLNSNSLVLSFDLIDLHDIKVIQIKFLNFGTHWESMCFYEVEKKTNCSFPINCVQSKCSLKLDGLKYNSEFKIRMKPISQYNFEFKSIEVIFRTKPWLPDNDYLTQSSKEIQSKIDSTLNVYFPNINQSNGSVVDSCLLMVKLGDVKIFNENNTFKIEDSRDQKFLKNLYYTTDYCSNETVLQEPCRIQKFAYNEKINTIKIIILGKMDNNFRLNDLLSNLTSFNYEYINEDLIESSNLYQLFFLFKIGDNQTELFLASYPTEPLQTTNKNSYIAGIKSRDGLWIIIILCVVSCVFLFGLIIILITLNFLRHKPSKFQKAAQINSCQHSFDLSGHPKSKYDDFLGSSDFVLPGEFSQSEMTNIWLVKHANGDLILDEEYRNLPDFRDLKTSYASQLISNEAKNRFLDIKAYDESRVILETSSQNNLSISTESISDYYSETDYINANFVQGYSHDKKFIATQGPKKETISDFWRMIYQYKVSAVVMLTKLVEKGVERCTQYWPDKLNMSEVYGDYEITFKDEQKCGDYIKRTFELTKIGTNKNTTVSTVLNTPNGIQARKILTVNQYFYPEWPDKDTPSTDPISVLHLIRDVNKNHLAYQYPIVVHCSAGVGRTGTYITLDAMMDKINKEAKIDIFGFISQIRTRRQYLVQTSKQYIFIHEALYEYCLYGFTDIDVSKLVSHYKYLKKSNNNNNGKKSKLIEEFEKLNNAFYPNCIAREAFNNNNKHKNRNLDCICYDENRIRLSNLNGSSYINATLLKGFDTKNELIITQDPMEHTEFEFWKMITEYNCKIIVALNKNLEKEFVYWPNDLQSTRNCQFDSVKFVIQLVNSEEGLFNGMITKREFELVEHKYSENTKMHVVHFLLNLEWLEDKIPSNKACILDLIGQIQKLGSNFEGSRITVHAYDGGNNCSVFCALNILLYQLKNDQSIDICRIVKKLKTQRPRMIESFHQYEFLYESLVEFVDMFGIYCQSTDSLSSKISTNDSFNN